MIILPLQSIKNEDLIFAKIEEFGSYAVFMTYTMQKTFPTQFGLKSNYPNPFNPSTTIPLELPKESYVEIAIFNLLGEKIAVLAKEVISPGYHNIKWNGTNQYGSAVSSGIYFARIHIGKRFYQQKMMLLK